MSYIEITMLDPSDAGFMSERVVCKRTVTKANLTLNT